MTADDLAALLADETEDFERRISHWQFAFYDVPMACLVDEEHDRMRIIAAIGDADQLDEGSKDAMLAANFHTALDARYGVSNGLVFAAFIHPLGSLDPGLLRSALEQVASLVHTFGSDFTGGTLEFVGGDDDDESDDDDDERKRNLN
ncbi:hypothetical protein ACNOYE_13095 [Nannocystaceae bacterium ST9]